jgi:hypothetical protein
VATALNLNHANYAAAADAVAAEIGGIPADADSQLMLLLEDVFLRGTLLKRSLKLPTANVSLYFRSPSEPLLVACNNNNILQSDSNNNTASIILSAWPYTAYPQCV